MGETPTDDRNAANPAGHSNRTDRIDRSVDDQVDEFVAALERLRPRLAAFVRRQLDPALRARESGSDVVQSVFREVLQNRERFDFQGDEALRAWLFSWAANKIRDRQRYWRAQRRDVGREAAPAAGDDDARRGGLDGHASMATPSREAMLHEQIARIEAACDRLPPDYREVITLSRLGGWTHADVAAHMGRSEGAVKMLLNRAIVRLTTELERIEGIGDAT